MIKVIPIAEWKVGTPVWFVFGGESSIESDLKYVTANPTAFHDGYGSTDGAPKLVSGSGVQWAIVSVPDRRRRTHIRPFGSLTPRGKFVRVAKDVLAQLAAKRVVAQGGVYIAGSREYISWNDSISTLSKCEACARGSMVISIAGLSPIHSGLMVSDGAALLPFVGICSEAEAVAIERWFEGGAYEDVAIKGNTEATRTHYIAMSIWHENNTDEMRLTALMNHIIKHRGKFLTRQFAVEIGILTKKEANSAAI